jgi:hypothetical protein
MAPRNASQASPKFGNAPHFLTVKRVAGGEGAPMWCWISLKRVASLESGIHVQLTYTSRPLQASRCCINLPQRLWSANLYS